MTTSNHRPFTYPDRAHRHPVAGRAGRRRQIYRLRNRQVHRRGAYAALVRRHAFRHTADHCAAVAGKTRLPMSGYLIPMIMYAPALVGPGLYTRLASQIDVPPTILDLLGRSRRRPLLRPGAVRGRGSGRREHSSATTRSSGTTRTMCSPCLLPKQRVEAFRIDPASLESTPIEPDRGWSTKRSRIPNGVACLPHGQDAQSGLSAELIVATVGAVDHPLLNTLRLPAEQRLVHAGELGGVRRATGQAMSPCAADRNTLIRALASVLERRRCSSCPMVMQTPSIPRCSHRGDALAISPPAKKPTSGTSPRACRTTCNSACRAPKCGPPRPEQLTYTAPAMCRCRAALQLGADFSRDAHQIELCGVRIARAKGQTHARLDLLGDRQDLVLPDHAHQVPHDGIRAELSGPSRHVLGCG